MMGLIAYDQRRFDRARTAWSRALESGSSRVQANAAINLAQIQRDEAEDTPSKAEQRKRLHNAEALLDRACGLDDPHEAPRVARLLGDVATDLGELDVDRNLASRRLGRAQETFVRAEEAYRAAMATRHPDEAVRAMWGDVPRRGVRACRRAGQRWESMPA
jgi:tetratricopeptide (TPR) repeat protein